MRSLVELTRHTEEMHDRLFADVTSVDYAAFPDHGNVGDSAIALGMMSYLRRRGIRIRAINSVGADPRRFGAGDVPVLIQGGGNLGGLYPHVDTYRRRLLGTVPPNTLLIQAPQSVHFVSEAAKREFAVDFASERYLRLAVRDRFSAEEVAFVRPVFLVPDSVHLLGGIEAAAPTRERIVLARRDGEQVHGRELPAAAVDWIRDSATVGAARRVRWAAGGVGGLGVFGEMRGASWEALARKRLSRGVRLLACAETVITDRLHAMLIALQMGRRVIAVDNANGKLTNYANTWLSDVPSDRLAWADSFDDAIGSE